MANTKGGISMKQEKWAFSTRAIQSGELVDPVTRALNTPIYQTSTFAFESARDKESAVDAGMSWTPDTYFYSRTGNPTTAALENKLASLEGAEDAVVTASGMSACATALLSLLNAGDHCIASTDLFTITQTLLDDVFNAKGIEVTRIDTNDIADVTEHIRSNTKVIFVESLSNPYMNVADIPNLSKIAHENDLYLIVDNTFLSPYLLRPLEFGADLVVHSATKYIAGHGDALAGAVAGDKSLVNRVRYYMDNLGSPVSPFNSWLILRGIRTLPLRMRTHSLNGQAVAELLQSRPEVEFVLYPGLENHPHNDVARKLLREGNGGMLALRLHGGAAAMETFAANLELSAIAVSLGDVRSLVYPMPKRQNLIRLSIGCEDVGDLYSDFAQALDKISS
ncbi:trans-sulfuration enzyme family protein [Pseudalkalibacillus sp. A8]|uniref:trans-sulfuration enzyme family protein n=1 Tax=Pseudalkalibacillus sp. A8 TaxID=3382641 RepID=UPI0038B669C9